ncbi:MAG: oxygen-independent coproporphyrinogen III oxidase [Bdellovibrionales bacterium]|nr:oxygen-independent coproporphyrinogen III oxidase [Bdellovibrionales bacterium]
MNSEILSKYDVPVPRYTSYPTVPYWDQSPSREDWFAALHQEISRNPNLTWSLYLHIPFCETLCTFCGCNTVITKDHKRELPYIRSLIKEKNLYLNKFPELFKRPLQQLHLGGGTPTFLQPQALVQLVKDFLQDVQVDPKYFEGSIEVDPRRTSREHLKVLKDLGFNRVSMGVQDFDPEVQRLVHRIQPLEQTQELTQISRDLGYTSVNYDLIYGLPKQTLDSFTYTAQKTVQLQPDRIALYSFAKVPWIKPQQRLFKDEDLPEGLEKRQLYERAYEILTDAGYLEIGMDHFALPSDSLAEAFKNKRLHRNFMGYTDQKTDILLGLGVSSISESPTCFHQNEKILPVYESCIHEGKIPTFRGHLLSQEDQIQRKLILQFMTEGEVTLGSAFELEDAKNFLKEMIEDQLITILGDKVKLTANGRPFLRNACVFLDKKMRQAKKNESVKIFSQAL